MNVVKKKRFISERMHKSDEAKVSPGRMVSAEKRFQVNCHCNEGSSGLNKEGAGGVVTLVLSSFIQNDGNRIKTTCIWINLNHVGIRTL